MSPNLPNKNRKAKNAPKELATEWSISIMPQSMMLAPVVVTTSEQHRKRGMETQTEILSNPELLRDVGCWELRDEITFAAVIVKVPRCDKCYLPR